MAATPQSPEHEPRLVARVVHAWWRKVPASALVAGAAVVGLAIGLAAPALVVPDPDAVLHATQTDSRGPTFGAHGILAGPPTRHENFHDLDVWSARLTSGASCLLVRAPDLRWTTSGCAPPPLDPLAGLSPYPSIRAIEGFELPIGSEVRFILHDGAVQVWIDEYSERT